MKAKQRKPGCTAAGRTSRARTTGNTRRSAKKEAAGGSLPKGRQSSDTGRIGELKRRIEELTRINLDLSRRLDQQVMAQSASSRRQQALEALYAITTAFAVSSETMYDQIVVALANLLCLPFVSFGRIAHKELVSAATFFQGQLLRTTDCPLKTHPCGIAARNKAVCAQKEDQLPRSLCTIEDRVFDSYLGVPILGRSGELIGVLCALDGDRRTFSEEEVRLMEIFARYIRQEIEREVMEEQLLQSREMRILGQLTAGVAHEVRNPLNALQALSEALFQDIGDNRRFRPYLDHIRAQVARLSALMRDLLDLGGPIRDSELRLMPVDSVLTSALGLWNQIKAERRHRVRVEIPKTAGDWQVRIEPVKIQQVFTNLIENAVDHSPTEAEVSLRVLEPDHDSVRIQVCDSGSGIAPDLLSRIFEPFFTTRKGGTGLGLNIVKHILEAHGGEISVCNNTPRPGSTAEVRLPLVTSGVQADTRAASLPG